MELEVCLEMASTLQGTWYHGKDIEATLETFIAKRSALNASSIKHDIRTPLRYLDLLLNNLQ